MWIRIGVIAGAITLLLCASAVSADDLVRGKGPIEAKNTRTRTIQIDDTTYRVEGNTEIRDPRGNRLGIRDVMVPDLAEAGAKAKDRSDVMGRFVAERESGRWVLRSLVVEPEPR